MELHEAIRLARKQRLLTQQQLADLAGIERKQLSILESGGNVTLATVKKVLAHLPNLPTFTLGGGSGSVGPAGPPSQVEIVEAASKVLTDALRTIVGALTAMAEPPGTPVQVPATDEEGVAALNAFSRKLYMSAGHTAEEFDRMVAEAQAQAPPEPDHPLTEEEAAEAMKALQEALRQTAANFAAMEEEEREEEAEKASGAGHG